MSDNDIQAQDFNRRDFLKNGSVATLMAMMGGVELFAQSNAVPAHTKATGPKLKIGVVGLGSQGREMVSTLAKIPQAQVIALCDTYPASLKRSADSAPGALQTADYKTLLENKDIKAIVVATPTHQHKEIVLAALKAGKHVYCEAPLAHSLEDARVIALAAKAAKHLVFQAGLQLRSNPQRQFLLPFIRSGALGKSVMARAQFHKKTSWRFPSPKPEREKELNWRLDKEVSLGLVGELGIHALDQAGWFFNLKPKAVSGWGSLQRAEQDGREVADTVQVVLEFAEGVNMVYDATLANSFDGEYEALYGGDAAVMMRDDKAWMFKEVDSALLGWEVYAKKETFYKETGIVLKLGGSKSTDEGTVEVVPFVNTPLYFALTTFVRNGSDVTTAAEEAAAAFGDDEASIAEQVAKVSKRPAAGFLEGFRATVTAIKANEAIVTRQRIELKREWYELA